MTLFGIGVLADMIKVRMDMRSYRIRVGLRIVLFQEVDRDTQRRWPHKD